MYNALLMLFPDAKEGDWLLQDDGEGPYIKELNRVEPQPTEAEIEAAIPASEKARKVADVKATAQRKIYAFFPQWKQANRMARGIEFIKLLVSGGALTVDEQEEMAAGFALWGRVKAIRAASDLIEADINNSTDPANFNVENSPRWPE